MYAKPFFGALMFAKTNGAALSPAWEALNAVMFSVTYLKRSSKVLCPTVGYCFIFSHSSRLCNSEIIVFSF